MTLTNTMPVATGSADVYTDFKGLAALKNSAKGNSPEALRAVAKQYESMFTRMMIKSMRDAVGKDPIFGSDQEQSYQEMYDDQLSIELSKGKGLGLADVLVRQMQKLTGGSADTEAERGDGDRRRCDRRPAELPSVGRGARIRARRFPHSTDPLRQHVSKSRAPPRRALDAILALRWTLAHRHPSHPRRNTGYLLRVYASHRLVLLLPSVVLASRSFLRGAKRHCLGFTLRQPAQWRR